jgi:hypothetical protein
MEPHRFTTVNPADRKTDDQYAHGDATQFQQTSPMLYKPDQHDNPRPHVLLILVAGASLQPSDYEMLCACICDAFKHSPLALWLCVCSMSWRFDPTSLQDQFDVALESALETAMAEGFNPLAPHPGGRNENVFVAMHSAAIMGATGFPLKRSAGIVALGSMLLPSESINMDAYTFPRPLMHIWGERDGQLNLFKASLVAGRALARDLPLGITVVSSLRPMLVVPGMNHAQFSNGIIRKERGDFDPDVPQHEALSLVSKGMLHFLTVNCAHMGIPGINVSTAVQVLTSMTEEAARFIDIPAVALGRASPIKILQLSKVEDDQEKPSSQVGEEETMLLALACGAEAYPKSSKLLQQLAHPGEEKAAREFAINAQFQVFRKVMAPEVVGNIRITATVHHLKETFLRSQAEIMKTAKGWGVHVHILLWREGLTSSYSPLTFVSPTYALKLKQGNQLLKVGCSYLLPFCGFFYSRGHLTINAFSFGR